MKKLRNLNSYNPTSKTELISMIVQDNQDDYCLDNKDPVDHFVSNFDVLPDEVKEDINVETGSIIINGDAYKVTISEYYTDPGSSDYAYSIDVYLR